MIYYIILLSFFLWWKKYLNLLIIFIYSNLVSFKINDTLLFPVFINNELLYITLTKVKSSFILKRNQDIFTEKNSKILLSYTLGHNFEKQIKLINKETFEEVTLNIKDVIADNFHKI